MQVENISWKVGQRKRLEFEIQNEVGGIRSTQKDSIQDDWDSTDPMPREHRVTTRHQQNKSLTSQHNDYTQHAVQDNTTWKCSDEHRHTDCGRRRDENKHNVCSLNNSMRLCVNTQV